MTEHAVGQAVRHARELSGTSLRSLARQVGISPATLSALETGKSAITVDRLRQLADALGVPIGRLLTEASRPRPRPGPGTVQQHEAANWRHFGPLELDAVGAAALRVFVARGFHAATMREVAAEAGLSVAGVYHHHTGKQQLLVDLLDLTMAEIRARLLAARAEAGTEAERFARMVEALALFHALRPELAFLGASEMRGLPAADRERITALRNEVQYLLDDQADAAIRAGELAAADPRTACRAIATMCTSLPSWFSPDGKLTAQEVARRYADYALVLLG